MSNAQGFWFDLVRRLGIDPALPPSDADEAWDEYLNAPEKTGAAAGIISSRLGPGAESCRASNSLTEHSAPPRYADIYNELRSRAEALMRHQRLDHTLQPTALVNEAFLKLADGGSLEGMDRAHMLALAATAMRHVLVDHARARARLKRSAPGQRVDHDDLHVSHDGTSTDLIALDEALTRLARFDSTMARAVELHFFAGLDLTETARAVNMPLRTFERRWAATRAWLRSQLQ